MYSTKFNWFKFFFVLTFLGSITTSKLYALYGNGQWGITVTDIATGSTVKTFTISTPKPAFFAIDIKEDLLFFTDEKNMIHRIYLVDDNGDRKVSGTGQLFTDASADHIEQPFYQVSTDKQDVKGMFLDKYLYTILDCHSCFDCQSDLEFIMVDPLNEKFSKKVEVKRPKPQCFNEVKLSNKMIYGVSGGCVFNMTIKGKSLTLKGKAQGNPWSLLYCDQSSSISIASIDDVNNRLYFTDTDRGMIKVLDGNIKQTKDLKERVVCADSEFTLGVSGMTVRDEYVLWSSDALKKGYVGELNEQRTFMPKRNIHDVDGGSRDGSCDHESRVLCGGGNNDFTRFNIIVFKI